MSESGNMDHGRRFGGIARLYGAQGLERLAASHVCVVGVGGVGSWVAEALARSALGHLTLIDLDHLAESNINRQIHALDGELGRAKVQAMGERIQAINPACRVEPVEAFVTVDNLERLIPGECDWVVDCIDAFRVKAALIAHCRRRKQRLVTLGGAGGRTDPARIRVADLSRTEHDPLLSRTRKLLRKAYGFPRNPKRRFEVPCVYSSEQARYPDGVGGVCMGKPAPGGAGLNCGGYGAVTTVTASFGLMAASLVLNRISGA